MQYESYLLTMAQIAGVLVGFASLANAISRPGMAARELQLNKLRILVTTENGIFIIIFCMLPVLLARRMDENELFRWLSLLAFAANGTNLFYIMHRNRRFTGAYFPVTATRVIFINTVLFTTIPFGLNAVGAFGVENSAFAYCGVIFYLFCMVCILFVRLLFSVLPDADKAA